MSETNANYETQEEYLGKIGRDMHYAKPAMPQTPPVARGPMTDQELKAILKSLHFVEPSALTDVQLSYFKADAWASYRFAEMESEKRERRAEFENLQRLQSI